MNKADTIKNITLIVLLIVSALCLMSDNARVYGVITLFGAALYLLWNDGDDDDDIGMYNLKY